MSLKWKAALLIFTASLLMISITFEFVLYKNTLRITKQQSEEHQQLLSQLSRLAKTSIITPDSNALSTTDFNNLQQRFAQYSELPQYQGFYLYQKGKVLVAHEAGLALPLNPKQYPYHQTVIAEQDTHLLMILNTANVHPDVFILSNNYWLIILALSLLLTLIAYLSANRVAHKVDEVVIGISKAGGGNYSQRIMISGTDEITQLSISYNRMLDNLLLTSQELKEELESYKTLLNNAVEGIITVNERGIIEYYNQAATSIFENSAAGVIGTQINKLIPCKIERENEKTIVQDLLGLHTLSGQYTELEAIRHDDEYFAIEIMVSESSINNNLFYTITVRDIGQRKAIEQQKIKLQAELRSLQRQNTVGTLTAGIAHDFNNILGPVLGYADMAINEVASDSLQHKYLNHIITGAKRAKELVARLMSYTEEDEFQTSEFHCIPVIEDALKLLKSSLPSQLHIETYFITKDDRILADKTQFTQVIVTLVSFISQSTTDTDMGLSIRLDNVSADKELLKRSTILEEGNYVRLTIEDPSQVLVKNSVGDAGVDLSVAYEIISQFGGELFVESEGNKTNYTVYIPSIAEIVETEEVGLKRILSKHGELILYIDDDHSAAVIGKDILESLGYHVDICTDSTKALQLFLAEPNKYDMVITDQSMPELMGTQLAKEIKIVRNNIPIILVTGFSASISNRDLKESGLEACVSKPIIADDFGELVMKSLAKYRPTEE